MPIKALTLTFFVSFIFGIGLLIPRLVKNRQKLLLFSTALTFIIMLSLILIDLLPEIIELLNPFKNLYNLGLFLLFTILGILILKALDMFIPEHHHDHHENENVEKHYEHAFHIGLITAVSLVIHNLLEGMSIYITGLSDIKLGLMMALTVGLHNLPLGIEVATSYELKKGKKNIKKITIFILLTSSFVGALLLYLFNLNLSQTLEGLLLSLTLGMLIYIVFFELLNELKQNYKNANTIWGLGIGLILTILLLIL